jgi:hypothetical protein
MESNISYDNLTKLYSSVEVKVNLSLCFNWAPRHEGVLGEWRYISTHSLTSTLDGGEWSVSRPDRFTPKERAPGTNWIGGWVGHRAGMDAVVKRIPSPHRKSKPRTPIIQPLAQRYTDWAKKKRTLEMRNDRHHTYFLLLRPRFRIVILICTKFSSKATNQLSIYAALCLSFRSETGNRRKLERRKVIML